MPGRGKKSKGSTTNVTPKKKTRKAPNKPQSLPVGSTPAQAPLDDLDLTSHNAKTENTVLARVMDLLIDISCNLEET